MSSFKNAEAGVIVDQLIKTIQKERDYLSEIDGKIGDGDHGINMNKGFTMCEKKLEGTTYNLSEGLTILGETLLEDIGGSMGLGKSDDCCDFDCGRSAGRNFIFQTCRTGCSQDRGKPSRL